MASINPFGGAAAPTGLVFLSEVVASAAATVDIEDGFSSAFDDYKIIGSFTGSDNTFGLATLKIGGSYLAAGYDGHATQLSHSSATYSGVNTNNLANATVSRIISTGFTQLTATITDANSSDINVVSFKGGFNNPTTSLSFFGSFGNRTAGVLTGFRIIATTGTITGTFRLYGIVNS